MFQDVFDFFRDFFGPPLGTRMGPKCQGPQCTRRKNIILGTFSPWAFLRLSCFVVLVLPLSQDSGPGASQIDPVYDRCCTSFAWRYCVSLGTEGFCGVTKYDRVILEVPSGMPWGIDRHVNSQKAPAFPFGSCERREASHSGRCVSSVPYRHIGDVAFAIYPGLFSALFI